MSTLQHTTLHDSASSRASWTLLLLGLLALTAYRAWVIHHTALPLYVDEAQYWMWSRELDWGYYSKPPVVAWVIRLFSPLGDGELAIRAGTLLLHALAAMLAGTLGRSMFDQDTGIKAALLLASMPLVGFNSLFMTTDAPLLFCWALAGWALWHALERNRRRDWLLLGCAAGLGLMSKYSMALLAPSVAVALCLPSYRRHWRNPRLLLAVLPALLLFLPNLWWNWRMDFVSFRHTAEISRLAEDLIHPAHLAEFIGAQALCLDPIGFAVLAGALSDRGMWRDRRCAVLAALTLPFLAVMSLQALLARANANWAAPACFGAAILVSARLRMRGRERWWLAALLLNLALLSLFYHYRSLAEAAGLPLTRARDPYARVLGWPQAGQGVKAVLARHPDARLVSRHRGEFALLDYYARPYADGARIWNPGQQRSNHFQLTADLAGERGANVIVATTEPLDAARSFERWRSLGQVTVPLYPGDPLRLYLYRGERFRGYDHERAP